MLAYKKKTDILVNSWTLSYGIAIEVINQRRDAMTFLPTLMASGPNPSQHVETLKFIAGAF